MQRMLSKCQNPLLGVFTRPWAVAKASSAHMELPFDLCFPHRSIPPRPLQGGREIGGLVGGPQP